MSTPQNPTTNPNTASPSFVPILPNPTQQLQFPYDTQTALLQAQLIQQQYLMQLQLQHPNMMTSPQPFQTPQFNTPNMMLPYLTSLFYSQQAQAGMTPTPTPQTPSTPFVPMTPATPSFSFGLEPTTEKYPPILQQAQAQQVPTQNPLSQSWDQEPAAKPGTKRRYKHAPRHTGPLDETRSKQAASRPRDEFGSFTKAQKTEALDLSFKLSSSEHECVRLRKDLAGKDQEMAGLKALLQEAERRNQEQTERMRFLEMQQQQRALEQLGMVRTFKARTQYLSQLQEVFMTKHKNDPNGEQMEQDPAPGQQMTPAQQQQMAHIQQQQMAAAAQQHMAAAAQQQQQMAQQPMTAAQQQQMAAQQQQHIAAARQLAIAAQQHVLAQQQQMAQQQQLAQQQQMAQQMTPAQQQQMAVQQQMVAQQIQQQMEMASQHMAQQIPMPMSPQISSQPMSPQIQRMSFGPPPQPPQPKTPTLHVSPAHHHPSVVDQSSLDDHQQKSNNLHHAHSHHAAHHNRAVPATWFNYETVWNENVLPAFREKIDFSTIQLKETEPPPNFVQQAKVEYFAAQEKWLEQLQQVSNLSGPLSPKKSPAFQNPNTSAPNTPRLKNTLERKAYTEKINFQDEISRLKKIDPQHLAKVEMQFEFHHGHHTPFHQSEEIVFPNQTHSGFPQQEDTHMTQENMFTQSHHPNQTNNQTTQNAVPFMSTSHYMNGLTEYDILKLESMDTCPMSPQGSLLNDVSMEDGLGWLHDHEGLF